MFGAGCLWIVAKQSPDGSTTATSEIEVDDVQLTAISVFSSLTFAINSARMLNAVGDDHHWSVVELKETDQCSFVQHISEFTEHVVLDRDCNGPSSGITVSVDSILKYYANS